MELTQQVQSYTAWVNSHLRKRNPSLVVEDIRSPHVCDGSLLGVLVEIVGGQPVPGIQPNPASTHEKISNISAIINLMQQWKVKMHTIDPKAIVSGDLKSIMRLILALAAHFKPLSVRPQTLSISNRSRRGSVPKVSETSQSGSAKEKSSADSLTQIMQGVAVDIAKTKQEILMSPSVEHRPHFTFDLRSREPHVSSPIDSPNGRRRYPSSSCSTAQSTTPTATVASSGTMETSRVSVRSTDSGVGLRPQSVALTTPSSDADVGHKQAKWVSVVKEVRDVRSVLEELQRMLLVNPDASMTDSPDDRNLAEKIGSDAETLADRVADLESSLEAQREETAGWKESTQYWRRCVETMNARWRQETGTMEEVRKKDSEIQRLLRKCEDYATEKQSLENKIGLKKEIITDQLNQLSQLNREIVRLGEALKVVEQKNQLLVNDLKVANHERKRLADDLNKRMGEHERQSSSDESRLVTNDSRDTTQRQKFCIDQSPGKGITECIASLRHSLAANDPQHFTLDRLEHCFSQLHLYPESPSPLAHRTATLTNQTLAIKRSQTIDFVDNRVFMAPDHLGQPEIDLRLSSSSSSSNQSYPTSSSHASSPHFPLRGSRDFQMKRQPISALPGFPVQRLDTDHDSESTTKLLYFTDRTITPFMLTLPKRLVDVRLSDVKRYTQCAKPGYRFLFKTLDREFGPIKEEVSFDEDRIPSWEGKIIAWIHQDHVT